MHGYGVGDKGAKDPSWASKGMVHADIKPENFLVIADPPHSAPEPRLIDFETTQDRGAHQFTKPVKATAEYLKEKSLSDFQITEREPMASNFRIWKNSILTWMSSNVSFILFLM